jgi:hypothetical protein
MQHGDSALERGLDFRVATRRERHLADNTGLRIRIVRVSGAVKCDSNQQWEMKDAEIHGVSSDES